MNPIGTIVVALPGTFGQSLGRIPGSHTLRSGLRFSFVDLADALGISSSCIGSIDQVEVGNGPDLKLMSMLAASNFQR